MKRKLIALLHWWLQLEPIRHRHWCEHNNGNCEHEGSCWFCEGVFCVAKERKNCPGCAKGKPCPRVPLDKRYYGYKCECGLGN